MLRLVTSIVTLTGDERLISDAQEQLTGTSAVGEPLPMDLNHIVAMPDPLKVLNHSLVQRAADVLISMMMELDDKQTVPAFEKALEDEYSDQEISNLVKNSLHAIMFRLDNDGMILSRADEKPFDDKYLHPYQRALREEDFTPDVAQHVFQVAGGEVLQSGDQFMEKRMPYSSVIMTGVQYILNRRSYGHYNWASWSMENWGCLGNLQMSQQTEDGDYLICTYEAPPTEALKALTEDFQESESESDKDMPGALSAEIKYTYPVSFHEGDQEKPMPKRRIEDGTDVKAGRTILTRGDVRDNERYSVLNDESRTFIHSILDEMPEFEHDA